MCDSVAREDADDRTPGERMAGHADVPLPPKHQSIVGGVVDDVIDQQLATFLPDVAKDLGPRPSLVGSVGHVRGRGDAQVAGGTGQPPDLTHSGLVTRRIGVGGFVAVGRKHGHALQVRVPDQHAVRRQHLDAGGPLEFAGTLALAPDHASVRQVRVEGDDGGFLPVDHEDATARIRREFPHVREEHVVTGRRLEDSFAGRVCGPRAVVRRRRGLAGRTRVPRTRGGEYGGGGEDGGEDAGGDESVQSGGAPTGRGITGDVLWVHL